MKLTELLSTLFGLLLVIGLAICVLSVPLNATYLTPTGVGMIVIGFGVFLILKLMRRYNVDINF